MFKRFVLLAVLLVSFVAYGGIIDAATYEYKFPISCTDNTSASRAYLPVMLGFGGQQVVDAGKIDSDGLDTNMQIGSTNAKYMMSTTNVTVVIPSLPVNGKQTLDFYTGYSPEQTTFAIIPGVGGYITTSDHVTIELWNNFKVTFSAYVDTSASSSYPTVSVSGGNQTTNNTTHTVSLPSVEVDDLLLVLFASDDNPTITFPNEGADWIQLFETTSGTGVAFGAWYRITDGTEGSSITVTTSNAQKTAHTVYKITDYWGVPEDGTPATGTSVNPNPPSLSPSWGEEETLWFAVCGYDTNGTVSSYPSGYGNGRNDYADSTVACGVGSARLEAYGSSEDPGTFTITANDEWVANTIAIRGNKHLLYKPDAIKIDTYDSSINATILLPTPVSVTASSVSSGEIDVLTQMDSPFLSLGIDQTSPITPISDNLVLNIPLWQAECNADPFTTIDDSETSVDVYLAVWTLDEGYNFNGVDDYLEVSHNATQLLTTGGSIEAWIKADTTGEKNTGRIIDKSISKAYGEDGYALYTTSTNRVAFAIDNGAVKTSATGSVVYGDGNWYHIIVTWDNTGYVTLYVNGSQSGTTGISADPAGITTANAIGIGNRSTGTNRTFDGQIGEVRLYNEPLTPTEILQNYNATKSKYTSGDIYTYSTLDEVPDNSNDYLFNTGDVMPYCDNITFSINGTQHLWYEPNSMLDGVTLPDRAGTAQDGTITWGSNTGVEIVFGVMEGSATTAATANETGGFDMPSATMPTTWFAAGENLANLPFYDSFNEVSSQTGQPLQTIYFLAIIGVAFGAFFLLTINTRAALLGLIGFNIVLFIGSSMTIVPMWIPFATIIVQIGILYLYRQVAY